MYIYLLPHLTLVWGAIYLPPLAHAADERIALMLTGAACPQNQAAVERKLSEIPGVRHIELHAIPDHVLLDADFSMVNGEALATAVNDVLAARRPCSATLMKSCVSADLRIVGNRVTREASSTVQLGQ
jgi:hypothetical protein